MQGPTLFDTKTSRTYREPRPTVYLELQHAGQDFVDTDGIGKKLVHDAVATIHPDGEGTVYYYEDGAFHAGHSLWRKEEWSPVPRPSQRER